MGKKFFLIGSYLLIEFIVNSVYAQDKNYFSLINDTINFHLSIGNKWYYQASLYNQSRHFNIIKTISDTTLTGTRLVSIKQIYPDSITYDNEEWIYTEGKLSVRPSSGDLRGPIFDISITRDTVISNFIIYEAYKIINIPIFGSNYFGQHYFWGATSHVGSSGYEYKIANQIGTTFIREYQYFGGSIQDTFYLIGALLEGALMGDSVFTTINSDWEKLNSGVTTDIHSVSFVDENTGFVVGDDGLILCTTNAGNDWSQVISNTNVSLRCIDFFNADIGFIAGLFGTVLKTSDGGYNWSILTTGIGHDLYSVDVVSENIVYAVGENGIVLKSTDSGNSWSNNYTSTVNRLYSVFFNNISIGYAAGGADIVKTSDGGASWYTVQTSSQNAHFKSIFFTGFSNGYVSGIIPAGGGGLLKSTDGGNTWTSQTTPPINILNSVYFVNNELGISVGYGNTGTKILQTSTSGNEWIEAPCGIYEELNSVFIYGNKAYTVGTFGTILKRSLPDSINEDIPKDYFLSQNYPNPFNFNTMIIYGLSDANNVTLKVYDILGNEVATLVNEEKPAGTYEIEFNAPGLPSGVYFYALRASSFVETKKMLLLK